MSPAHRHRSLADLVLERPSRAEVLEDLGLDFCCGGRRSLAEACEAAALDVESVLSRLDEAEAAGATEGGGDCSRARTLATPDLLLHLVDDHHAFLRRELPRLSDLAAKVGDAHGARHPELRALQARLVRFSHEMELHMLKEEEVLFPAVRQLVETGRDAGGCGDLELPLRAMEADHEDAGAALDTFERLTGGFQVPPDGCASWRALAAGLADLAHDLHLHVHEENNLLHPRVRHLLEAAPSRRRPSWA